MNVIQIIEKYLRDIDAAQLAMDSIPALTDANAADRAAAISSAHGYLEKLKDSDHWRVIEMRRKYGDIMWSRNQPPAEESQ